MSDKLVALYGEKDSGYFANTRADIVAMLPADPHAAILELGCGAGNTGRAALAAGKAGRYVGLELDADAAAQARTVLSEVLLGDVETLDLARFAGGFDVLIVSEVLEHLVDPWGTLRRLATCLKPGAMVVASSPNVSDWRMLRRLAGGDFDYAESGTMDRTHIRWFTPRSFRALFEQAGIAIDRLGPIRRPGIVGRTAVALSGGRLQHLFMTQMMVVGRKR